MADIANVRIVTSKGAISAGKALPSDLPKAELEKIKELGLINRGKAVASTDDDAAPTGAKASSKKTGPSNEEKKAKRDAEKAVKDAEAAVKNAASDDDRVAAEELLAEAKQALADLG
ncbi:hypothetical protein WKW50_05510 [Ochrobactrum sp. GPK 3]